MRSRAARRAIGFVIGVGLVVPVHRLSEGFWLTTLPRFIGSLLGVALFVSPWFLLRRWLWGRVAMVVFGAFLALGALNALTDPYFPAEDKGGMWTSLLPLPAILALMRHDRKRRAATAAPQSQAAEEATSA